MAIITAIDLITKGIDKKEHVIGLFLDLRKAFDTVNKEILIQKLERYGIWGKVLKWFYRYLDGRTQKAKCLGYISDVKDIEKEFLKVLQVYWAHYSSVYSSTI